MGFGLLFIIDELLSNSIVTIRLHSPPHVVGPGQVQPKQAEEGANWFKQPGGQQPHDSPRAFCINTGGGLQQIKRAEGPTAREEANDMGGCRHQADQIEKWL